MMCSAGVVDCSISSSKVVALGEQLVCPPDTIVVYPAIFRRTASRVRIACSRSPRGPRGGLQAASSQYCPLRGSGT